MRESSSRVKIFKNFKERAGLLPKLNYAAEGIFGGALLGVRSSGFLNFYDWETGSVVRRIDVEAKNVSTLSHDNIVDGIIGLLVGCTRSCCYCLRGIILRTPI